MELKVLKASLDKIAPTAYRAFGKDDVVPPPFICYFVDSEAHSGADDKNYIKEPLIIVELYLDKKDLEIEGRLDRLFEEYEFDKYETWIEDEKLLQIAYHLPIIEKI